MERPLSDTTELFVELIHKLKDASYCFHCTANYLRQRRECPGKEMFDRGIKILDTEIISIINKIDLYKAAQHDPRKR